VILLLAAPHHTIPRSGNVRIYATYLQLRCGLRPTTARQAMQTCAIEANLANHRRRCQKGNSLKIRHLTAPLAFALLPTRCLFVEDPIACAVERHPLGAYSERYLRRLSSRPIRFFKRLHRSLASHSSTSLECMRRVTRYLRLCDATATDMASDEDI
jgi:hypothetical protein